MLFHCRLWCQSRPVRQVTRTWRHHCDIQHRPAGQSHLYQQPHLNRHDPKTSLTSADFRQQFAWLRAVGMNKANGGTGGRATGLSPPHPLWRVSGTSFVIDAVRLISQEHRGCLHLMQNYRLSQQSGDHARRCRGQSGALHLIQQIQQRHQDKLLWR